MPEDFEHLSEEMRARMLELEQQRHKLEYEIAKKRWQRRRLYSMLLALTASAAAITGSIGALLQLNHSFTSASTKLISHDPTVAAIAVRLDSLDMRLSQALRDTSVISRRFPTDRELTALDARMSRLEDAIELDPLKTLSVAMLRKDLDNTATTLHAEIAADQEAIRSWYDFSKWFLGIMLTNSIALLGLVFATFRTSQKKE